jgi:hypothetical protein
MKLSRSKGMASMLAVLGLFVFAMAAPAFADSYSVDISSATFGFSAPVTTQYASDGITFAAETTGGVFYAPETGGDDWTDTDPIDGVVSGLSNSPTGEYPTTEFLDINFTNPASGVSFWYDNFGTADGPGERGDSSYTAYNALDEVVSTGDLSVYTSGFNQVTVTGSGISEIVIDNSASPDTFTDSEDGDSWEFGVTRVDYTTSVPEPSSLALLAFGMLGLVVVSKKLKITTNAA